MVPSIRRHVLKWLLAAVGAGSAALALATYALTRAELDHAFDEQLKQVALTVLTRYDRNGSPPATDRAQRSVGLTDDLSEYAFVVQAWTLDGRLLFASDARVALPFVDQEGFRTVDLPQGAWRVHTDRSAAYFIQAGQPVGVRRTLAADAAFKILVPCLLAGPLLALLVGVAVRRGLRPLVQTADALGRSGTSNLEPIARESLPSELRPLVDAINGLMDRLSRALNAQRRFTADAAHELRTPLTAVGLQFDVLLQAASPSARAEAADDIRQGLARAARLVDELLQLAVAEDDAWATDFAPVDLAALARSAVADFVPQADRRGIDLGAVIGVEDDGVLVVHGNAAQLRVLIGCLIDNALRYSRESGRVDVVVDRERGVGSGASGSMALTVSDDGPGIPESERERVFERFYRGASARSRHTASMGNGLGLSIVRAIAEAHGAGVELRGKPVPEQVVTGEQRFSIAVRFSQG